MVMLIEGGEGRDLTEIAFQNIVKNKNPKNFNDYTSYIEALLSPGEYTVVVCPERDFQVGGYQIEARILSDRKF
jgi:hypothetical protein